RLAQAGLVTSHTAGSGRGRRAGAAGGRLRPRRAGRGAPNMVASPVAARVVEVVMSGWFQQQIVSTGRLPLFCFFVALVVGFGVIRVNVRLIRAPVRWCPATRVAGAVPVPPMVFGVVFMGVGGVAELAAPLQSVAWRAGSAALFGLGTALVLDEFALILHLRDVYWSNEGRVSVDAVFVAAGVNALLLMGGSPVGVEDGRGFPRLPPRHRTP